MSSESAGEAAYTQSYYLENCGGAEFFRLYGADVVKPVLAHALSRADLQAGQTALDAGCGRGELLYQLRRRGVAAFGADFSPAALALAARTSKAPVLRCDARRLPFKDRSFDRIFFLGVVDHLGEDDLTACFSEFKRTLKPGGSVLINTCVNTDYHKTLTYGLRKTMARALGLKEPRAPRSSEDEHLHVNEHNERGLRAFLDAAGWEGDIEPRPNEKYAVADLYEPPLPADFPLRVPAPWKQALHRLAFRRPWSRYLARELFCRVRPRAAKIG